MSEFQIGLVASLDSSKSKQQLNSDIEALKKQLTTVEVQATLGKDVVTNLTQQLNAVQINLNNVKVDQTAINNMISQFNTAFSKVNINLGNINTNGATQSAQKTGQQIGNQLGNSINQSLQANLNHVKQDIQNIFSSFSVQKLNNADIFKNFNLNRAKIDPSVTKDVQSLTAEINKLAREALKTNSDSAWEGITQKISNLSDVLNKFGATRDLSSFKEQMDLLDYFQGKKIFVGDKAEAIQNTGMSIRELNNQFRNLGVTFTTVENGSTKLDEIWSELFNIKPSFQGIDSFGGQINAVVNELKIAKEAMYGDSNLMPAQRTGATTTYLNAWLEMLEKLSQRIEILKTEQANLQNQMAQASNNATNAIVANQQKQQQAYQQTGSVIQAVTSNTSVIGNMPKEASDIGDAKNQLSQLLQNEKAVIATTQHFDNDGMMRTFTLNVKRATGEVESLNYAFRQVTDNNGNVTDTYFENTSSHLNDSGAIKQIKDIEEAFSDYTTKIAKFKSTNAEILSGLDTPLKDFETKLAGLKTGASTVNEVKSAFNSLNTEAAKITQNFSKQLSPIDRAVSKIANGSETIKGLRAELKGLDNTPKDLSKELNQCATALQRVKDIEAKEGRTENWSKAYKQWAESIDAVTAKIKTLKKEQSNVASTQVFNTSDLKANNIAFMSKVHNTIEKQMVEINRLANANGWSDVKVTGVEEASGKIQKLTLTVRDAEALLEAGKITYQQYSQYVSDELERMYKNGKISASKYYSAVKDMIDEQKSIYDAALKGVTKLLDDEIDKWKDKIDVIEKNNDKLNEQKDKYDSILSAIQKVYDDEIKKANKKKDSIQDVIDAMSDENDEYERQKKLQEAIYNLNKANSQKTKYLLKDGQFVYSTDNSAIRDAQDSLHDAQYDVDVANLKKQQDDIDNYIDTLNEFKDKWNEISDAFSDAQDAMNLKQYLGSEYQRIILSNNLADIENFKNQYVAVESQINSNEQLKTSYEEKVDYYNNLKQQWEDCTSKYDDEKNKLYASQILGANWEAEVLSGRQQTLANFTSEYEKLCQRQADATVNAYNTEVQAAKNAAAGIASVSSSVASSGGGSSSGGSSGGSSSSTHKVTYDKNNNPNKPALKSNDYWTYEKLSKKGYSTSGQASSHISDYASKGANGFTQIGNKYFIVKWIANAGSPANASKAKNKLEKDNPKKIGKYGYAKRYHKGLELGKIEALPKDKAFDLVQDVGTNGLEADEVPIIAQKGEAVLTEEQIENLAKTLHLVPVQNEIMEKMNKISLGNLPMNTPKMNFDASKVGQNVTRNNFAPSVNITFNCPNLTNESGVQYVEKAMDKYMNKFANDFYQTSLHYVNRKQ